MKEPFKGEEGANIDGASDNDCVGCDDEQEGKRKQRKEGRKKGKKNGRKKYRQKTIIFKILSGLVFYSIKPNRTVTVNKTEFLTQLHASLVKTGQNNVKENCVTLFMKDNLSAALWFNIVHSSKLYKNFY
jgi:hypothetical protein